MVWLKLLLDQTRALMEHLPHVLFAEMLNADCALFGIKVDIIIVCQLLTQWPSACEIEDVADDHEKLLYIHMVAQGRVILQYGGVHWDEVLI